MVLFSRKKERRAGTFPAGTAAAKGLFIPEEELLFDLRVPFTRESWNGRMKACRGIGASLPEAEVRAFEAEHLALLERTAPPAFEILHYAAISVLRVDK